MSYYQKHVFFCNNQRSGGKACCGNYHADEMRSYMKKKLKELKLTGAGKCRVNLAGCMGRCSEGPVLAVYPEGVWYTYSSQNDIDDIIQEHLVNGRVADRLRLPDKLENTEE